MPVLDRTRLSTMPNAFFICPFTKTAFSRKACYWAILLLAWEQHQQKKIAIRNQIYFPFQSCSIPSNKNRNRSAKKHSRCNALVAHRRSGQKFCCPITKLLRVKKQKVFPGEKYRQNSGSGTKGGKVLLAFFFGSSSLGHFSFWANTCDSQSKCQLPKSGSFACGSHGEVAGFRRLSPRHLSRQPKGVEWGESNSVLEVILETMGILGVLEGAVRFLRALFKILEN